MRTLAVKDATLSWSMLDLTRPWHAEPETIVMHHGVGACQALFDGWVPALMDRYRILRFDMRGHGESSRSGPGAALTMDGVTMDSLADDLLAVMDAAGVDRAHLVGESIGGTIALNTALRAPERVRSLTVSNGAHLGASIEAVADWQHIIESRGMAGWSAHMMAGRFHPGVLSDAEWRWFEAQQATACPHTVLALLRALVGADLVGRLAALRPPLLLLHPDGSPFIPVPVMADFQARVPGSRLHVFGHAKHGLPFSHAGQCAAVLRGFLDGTTG